MAKAIIHVEVLICRENLTPEQANLAVLDAPSCITAQSIAARIEGGVIDGQLFGAEEWEWLL